MPGIRHRGFTLIEMLIVLMTLGILAAVAAPSFARSTSRQTVQAAATVVAADVEAAFSLAARARRPMVLSCDPSTRTCRVTDQATGALRSERKFGVGSGFEVASLGWAPVNNAASVVLGPSGIATQGFTITLTQGSATRRVVVLRTGLARIN